MKPNIRHLWSTLTILASLALISAHPLRAQTFKTIYNFSAFGTNEVGDYTNADGCYSVAPLTISGGTLYGAAGSGGFYGSGTLFALNMDGTGFTNLHTFAPGDGAGPYNQVLLSGGYIYGTTFWGDNSQTGNGTVFKIGVDGTGFTVLASLENAQALILSGDTLCGTADGGNGEIFTANVDQIGYRVLHGFSGGNDGSSPGGLALSDTNLYGVTYYGGASNNGTLFKIDTNSLVFSVIHTFTPADNGPQQTNHDGFGAVALISSGGTLYGTANTGGAAGAGAIFALNTDGSGFRIVHSFAAGTYLYDTNGVANSDGVGPQAPLVLSGNTLYGTALRGGSFSNGTVFAVNTDGTVFKILHTFSGYSGPNRSNSDGSRPWGGLTLSGNTLYGTAEGGGIYGAGTIFSISLPPQLSITVSAGNVILTWPTNVAGLTLQSTPSITTYVVWTPVSPGPVVVNGLNTVTNPMVGAQQFYRLSQ